MKDLIICSFKQISTFSAIGSKIDSTSGSIMGAILGVFVSLQTCSCDDIPCSAPKFLGTEDICYNPYNGLTIKLSGYGKDASGFIYEVYNSDNLIPSNMIAQHTTSSPVTTFSDAELQGRDYVYIAARTNCSGVIKNPASAVMFNIRTLGKPSFTMTGSSTPYTNSNVYYSLIGRNIASTIWNVWSYGSAQGTILSQAPSTLQVQWNSVAGFAHVTATASSNCGSYSDDMYVTTHN